VIADESWFDSAGSGRLEAQLLHLESPPLSALVVDRGRYRGRTSANPALRGCIAAPQALEAPASRSRAHAVGCSDDAGCRLRGRLRAARDIVASWARERQLHGGDAREAARSGLRGAARRQRACASCGTLSRRPEIPLAGVRLADGSGLSSLDRLTATAVVALLEAGLAEGDLRDAFLQSLAVAGVDGTLEDRLGSSPARGQVIAKTGTTSGLRPLRLRPRPLRLRDPPERPADLELLGEDRPGPVRDGARRGRLATPPRRRCRGCAVFGAP
jgi:hypothetical protein